MAGCSYNCTELPDYVRVQCGAYKRGGISAIGVLNCDNGITDFTSFNDVQQAIADGELKIISGIKGEFPAGSPVEGDNPVACGNDTILDGFDYVLNFTDGNVSSSNDDFYAALNKRSTYLIIYLCQEQEILVIESGTNWIIPPAVIPLTKKEKQLYNATAKWTGDPDDFPTRYDASALVALFEPV